VSLPTVKEVAKRAGVSPMTVSRTLAGGANVRPNVQARVMAAVVELGYRRNEMARSLRPGHRSGLIGVAITNLGNPYYGEFAAGVEEIAVKFGRRILLGNSGEDLGREQRLVRDFVGRQVEGLILVPASQENHHLQPREIQNMPLVLASRMVEGVRADSVVLDDVGGARRGVETMLNSGYRRIAFLGSSTSVQTVNRRFAGYSSALHRAGLSVEPSLVAVGQQDVLTAQQATSVLLDSPNPPDAIFATNNRNAIGALREIGRRASQRPGVHPLPALLSFDDFELASLMPVRVVVIDHDPRELGHQAAQLLFDRLTSEAPFDAPNEIIEMPTTVRLARP
jgi:LacI family transcriptional regulator